MWSSVLTVYGILGLIIVLFGIALGSFFTMHVGIASGPVSDPTAGHMHPLGCRPLLATPSWLERHTQQKMHGEGWDWLIFCKKQVNIKRIQ